MMIAPPAEQPRILLPIAGPLDPDALDLAVRLAEEDDGMLVAAYLARVPLRYDEDASPDDAVWAAAEIFDAVELAALAGGVAVTTQIATGRTLRRALARLWERERFAYVVATAPPGGVRGISESDLGWLVANAPAAVFVVKPSIGAAA